MDTKFAVLVITAAIAGFTGCTHTQLRVNSVRQSNTLSEIHQQQVLNNLAKFIYDPNALPDFATPQSGFNQVQDQGNLGFGVSWIRNGFSLANLNGSGSRTANQNWTLIPVNDPRKLELMRCAYQKAVAGYTTSAAGGCPDCDKRFKEFYGSVKGAPAKSDPTKATTHVIGPGDESWGGQVTSKCLNTCWLHIGCGECLPKHHPCRLVGNYCGVQVWVDPGVGTDELSKLTLAILDYALNDPPAARQKQVVAYFGADGVSKATPSTAAYVVTAAIPFDKSAATVYAKIPSTVKSAADAPPTNKAIDELRFLPQRNSYQPGPLGFDQLFQQQQMKLGL